MQVQRRYDIDWLRTIGVLLVIPFHTLIMFNMDPDSIVYVKDTVNVPLFNILDGIINRFHMPLLFILAGMSANFALKSRSSKQFINERIRKLLIPFLLGCIFLNPIMTYLTMLSHNSKISITDHFFRFFTSVKEDLTGVQGGFTPAHLWFILFLFVFSLLGLPLMKAIQKRPQQRNSGIALLLEKPLLLTLTVIPAAILDYTGILDEKNPFVYFYIFLLGYFIASNKRYQIALDRDKWVYLIAGILMIYLVLFTGAGDNFAIQTLYHFFDMGSRIVPGLALIGFFHCYVNRNSATLRYVSKSSFFIYVIHLLVNTVVGFFILRMNINVYLKYIIVVVLTFAFCFLIYEIVRQIKIYTSK